MAGKSTYSAYKTDAARETKGVLLDLGDAGKFRIARAGGANATFQKRLAALTKPHRRAIQTGNVDEDVANRLMVQVYCETVLLGWEGVTDEDGAELGFSVAAAVKLLVDLPDLFKDIRQTADDASLFRLDLLETDAKNS